MRFQIIFASCVLASAALIEPCGAQIVRTHDDVMIKGEASGRRPANVNGGIAGSPAEMCDIDGQAWHGQPAPGSGGGTLSPGAFFNPATINSNGRIAFFAQVNGSARNQGIFVADAGGVLGAIVRGCGGGGGSGNPGTGCGDPSPIGGTFSGFFGGTVFAPALNDNGDVLFVADVHNGSAPRGLFLYRASTQQIVKIAAVNDPSPIGGNFIAVGPGSINDSGIVVFLASNAGTDSNIYKWDNGVVTSVAVVGDAAPGGGTFNLLGTESFGFQDGTNIPAGPVPDINDNNQITFRAIVSGGSVSRGIIVSQNGVHQWYIKAGDPVPGGILFDMQGACINNNGEIAFFADFNPQPGQFSSGWFAGMPSPLPEPWRRVLAFFDPIEGGICFGMAFSRNPMQAIDEDGNVTMWTVVQMPGGVERERVMVSMADGTQLVAAQQQTPTPLGGNFGALDAWPSLGRCRGTVSAGTPGAPNGIISAHFVYKLCGAGDVNADCVVDVNDLLAVVGAWGPCPPPCPADLNDDGVVDVNDLLEVVGNWD